MRLFDRHHRGIELTTYGRALLDCAAAVFDDLRQGVWHIEFRAPSETRIGGNEAIIAGLLSSVLERLRQIDNRTGEQTLESSITGYSFRRTAGRSRDKGWAASGGALKR